MLITIYAVVGASTHLKEVIRIGLTVLVFYTLILIFHFIFLVGLAELFKLDIYEVILASVAHIIEPSVVAPIAASMGQKKIGNTKYSDRNFRLCNRYVYWGLAGYVVSFTGRGNTYR